MTLLDYALAYAGLGFPVIPLYGIRASAPADALADFKAGHLTKKTAAAQARCACGKIGCTSPGKHPLVVNGVHDATTDAETIRQWWQRWPDANIGLRMPPGVVAIDFDLYEKGVRDRLAGFLADAPATAVQASGAGGEHWLYRVPPDTAFGSYFDGQAGVDLVHNNHRYLVVEPSVHWTGAKYEWRTTPDTLAEAPPAIAARCAVRGGGKKPVEGVAPGVDGRSKYAGVKAHRPGSDVTQCPPGVAPTTWAILVARQLAPAIEGGEEPGHVTLARAGAVLIGGLCLTPPQAVDILWQHYNPRCEPPWSEDGEGKDTFRDFERTVLTSGRDVEKPGWLLAAPPAPPPVEAGAPFVTLGPPIDFTVEPPPPKWLCQGLGIEAGGKPTAVAGLQHSGKGPFTNALAISVALGLDLFGKFPVEQGPVMILDWETGAYLSRRRIRRICRALGRDPADLADKLFFFDVAGGVSLERMQDIERFIRERGVKLTIVDSYTSAMLGAGLDANAVEYAQFLGDLAGIARAQDCVMMPLLHARKPEKANKAKRPTLSDVSGTGALAAMVQTAIMLWRPDDEKKAEIEVSCARSIEEPFQTFLLHWTDVPEPGRQSASAQNPKWGLKAEAIYAESGPKAGQPVALKTANDRREADRIRKDAESREDIVDHLTKHPFATERELVNHACGNEARSFYRVARALRKEGVIDTNGDVWYLVKDQPTPGQRFMNRAGK